MLVKHQLPEDCNISPDFNLWEVQEDETHIWSSVFTGYCEIHTMIISGTSPFLLIDRGENEPGMTLQRWEGKWVNYKVDGKVVKSPVDIEKLPPGKYRLV